VRAEGLERTIGELVQSERGGFDLLLDGHVGRGSSTAGDHGLRL